MTQTNVMVDSPLSPKHLVGGRNGGANGRVGSPLSYSPERRREPSSRPVAGRVFLWGLFLLMGSVFVARINSSLIGNRFNPTYFDSVAGNGGHTDNVSRSRASSDAGTKEQKSHSPGSESNKKVTERIVTSPWTHNSTKNEAGAPSLSKKANDNSVDFIIAGFPKCGTSTLVYTFEDNKETEMPQKEYCDLNRYDRSNKAALGGLKAMIEKEYTKPSPEDGTRPMRGLKCPNSVRFVKSLQRLELVNPDTKVIIGVRHPVLFFQSYYNYRVVSHNQEKLYLRNMTVPHPSTLIGGHDKVWRGVFTGMARYEQSLMQMGKVSLSTDELNELKDEGLRLGPVSLPVFIYEVDQFADPDKERSDRFRASLQHFLGLQNTIQPLEHRNVNANKGTYPETINICDEEYNEVRRVLIKNSERTRHWIRDKFIKSKDVIVGGDQDYFLHLLSKWSEDPCTQNQIGASVE